MKKETLMKLFANSTLAAALVVGMAGCTPPPADTPATPETPEVHTDEDGHDHGEEGHTDAPEAGSSEAGSTTGGGTDVPE